MKLVTRSVGNAQHYLIFRHLRASLSTSLVQLLQHRERALFMYKTHSVNPRLLDKLHYIANSILPTLAVEAVF